MFGMSFTEIMLIAVIAIIFLGPEKLPNAMVQIAKFFKTVKKGVSDAKETIDHELHLNELRESANAYKGKIENATSQLMDTTRVEEIVDVKESISSSLNSLNSAIDMDDKVVEKKVETPKSIKKSLEDNKETKENS